MKKSIVKQPEDLSLIIADCIIEAKRIEREKNERLNSLLDSIGLLTNTIKRIEKFYKKTKVQSKV